MSTKQCTFLDWAEAYVGNPFFSLQYLLEHFRRTKATEAVNRSKTDSRLRCAQWNKSISPTASPKHALSPLLAVFAYATGNEAWKDQKGCEIPITAGYLRSLTRRMNREAKQ